MQQQKSILFTSTVFNTTGDTVGPVTVVWDPAVLLCYSRTLRQKSETARGRVAPRLRFRCRDILWIYSLVGDAFRRGFNNWVSTVEGVQTVLI